MTVRMSSKFKELLLAGNSFPSIFDGGRIDLYTGSQPASADYPVQGTFLGSVTELGQVWTPDGGAGGLNFALSGVWAINHPSQRWMLTPEVAGTAGWFRLVARSLDDNELSFAAARLDGTVGASGAVDMKLESAVLVAGTSLPVQQFLFSFPPIL